MDGQTRIDQLHATLAIWRDAYATCSDKLAVLERLRPRLEGVDAEFVELLVDKERDICAQLRSRVRLAEHAVASIDATPPAAG